MCVKWCQEGSASLFDLTVLERSITQLSRQLSAEGAKVCSGLGGLNRGYRLSPCQIGCALGAPLWRLLTSLLDIVGNLGKKAPAYFLWHPPLRVLHLLQLHTGCCLRARRLWAPSSSPPVLACDSASFHLL